nr:hypothetical protein Iba_scaffold2300CG0970 [Ipomoea batatas]
MMAAGPIGSEWRKGHVDLQDYCDVFWNNLEILSLLHPE